MSLHITETPASFSEPKSQHSRQRTIPPSCNNHKLSLPLSTYPPSDAAAVGWFTAAHWGGWSYRQLIRRMTMIWEKTRISPSQRTMIWIKNVSIWPVSGLLSVRREVYVVCTLFWLWNSTGNQLQCFVISGFHCPLRFRRPSAELLRKKIVVVAYKI